MLPSSFPIERSWLLWLQLVQQEIGLGRQEGADVRDCSRVSECIFVFCVSVCLNLYLWRFLFAFCILYCWRKFACKDKRGAEFSQVINHENIVCSSSSSHSDCSDIKP